MKYQSKEELKDHLLEDGDDVVFKIKDLVLNYFVFNTFLANKSGLNDIIFEKLEIDDKYKFASYYYGYDCDQGLFPSCNKDDFKALTRITLALFEKCEEINNQMKNKKEENVNQIRTITVIYTNRILSQSEIIKVNFKEYAFLSDCDVLEVGQLISSPMYTSSMQIVRIEDEAEPYKNGKPLKHLIIDSINGIDISKFKTESKTIKSENIMNTTATTPTNKKSMLNNFFEKYKAQFMPEEDLNLKMSIDGNICVPINDEYVGVNKEGNLTSYPEEMCLDFPVYLISKPFSQVKIGDIIRVNKSYMKVLKKTENTLNCLTFSGYTRNSREIKDFVLGQSLVKVVINLFENTSFAFGNFNPMIMLMLGDKDFDMKDMLMMQMFQGNSDLSQMNPMLMMAMAKDGNSSSMIETMLMMQMMGNSQLPGFFSSPKVESKKTKKIKTEENSETEISD